MLGFGRATARKDAAENITLFPGEGIVGEFRRQILTINGATVEGEGRR